MHEQREADQEEQPSRSKTGFVCLFWILAVVAAVLALFGYLPRSPALPERLDTLGVARVPAVPATDFMLKSLTGQTVSLSHFRGNVVFLNFWATWCEPCKVEMPLMERLHRTLAQEGFQVVAVHVGKTDAGVEGFYRRAGLTFTVLLDRERAASQAYEIAYIPTTYIIDREGRFVGKVSGPRDWMAPQSVRWFEGLLKK